MTSQGYHFFVVSFPALFTKCKPEEINHSILREIDHSDRSIERGLAVPKLQI